MNLDELREELKEAGIKSTHLMKEDTLLEKKKELEEAKEIDIEPEKEVPIIDWGYEPIEDGLVIQRDLEKSDEMQLNGWEVVEILRYKDKEGRAMRDRPVYHKLRKIA